ncbi:MAG: ribosome small subunit-dependent GTPase A [candidate division Zixibacteria bacterium]|nr:ribosome small subunit-dependent GTPase A [candidate division Zixibacteria bacterium]
MMIDERKKTGRIIQALGSSFNILCNSEVIECFHRGKFRRSEDEATFPVVGDMVEISGDKSGYGIDKIHPRISKISREEVGSKGRREQVIIANLKLCVIVTSVDEPPFKPRIVDRMIVSCLKGGLEPLIVLNKCDLMKNFNLKFWEDIYEKIGYKFVVTSALTGEGIFKLKEHLSETISVFIGASGVGKSSLLNKVQPGLGIATKKVSQATSKGRHTTTTVTMHPIDYNGFVADTPGLKELGLWQMKRDELAWYFEEFRPFISECKFRDCLHIKEPGCNIKKAVLGGDISEIRYESYSRILCTIENIPHYK